MEAMNAFDLACMFANENPKITHSLLLMKAGQISLVCSLLHCSFQAIALFNANQHENAIARVQELASVFPNADTLACRIVEVSIMHSLKPRFVCRY